MSLGPLSSISFSLAADWSLPVQKKQKNKRHLFNLHLLNISKSSHSHTLTKHIALEQPLCSFSHLLHFLSTNTPSSHPVCEYTPRRCCQHSGLFERGCKLGQNRDCKSWLRHYESVCYQPGNKAYGLFSAVIEQSLSFSLISAALFYVVTLKAAFVTSAEGVIGWSWISYTSGIIYRFTKLFSYIRDSRNKNYRSKILVCLVIWPSPVPPLLCFLLNLAGSFSPQALKLLVTSIFSLHLLFLMCQQHCERARTHTNKTSGRWDVISFQRQAASRGFAAHSAPHLSPQTQVCWRASGRPLVYKRWTTHCDSFLDRNNITYIFQLLLFQWKLVGIWSCT